MRRAGIASGVHTRPPARFHRLLPAGSVRAAAAGRETHWHSPGVVADARGLALPGRMPERWFRRSVGRGSAQWSPGPPSGASQCGPATARRACCDSAGFAPACTGNAHWAHPCSRKGRGSSQRFVRKAACGEIDC